MRVQVGGRASEHLYFLCSSRSADQHSKSQGRKEGMKGSSRELHGDLSWKNSVYYSLTYVDVGLCLLNSARIFILIYQSDYATYMLRQYSFGSSLTAVKYRIKHVEQCHVICFEPTSIDSSLAIPITPHNSSSG